MPVSEHLLSNTAEPLIYILGLLGAPGSCMGGLSRPLRAPAAKEVDWTAPGQKSNNRYNIRYNNIIYNNLIYNIIIYNNLIYNIIIY
jgi:hypothetical protein